MKPLFKCELNYFPSPHLNQIYDGFEKLRKIGIIDVSIKPVVSDNTKPLLNVVIDNKYKVIYDTLDGMNWIDGTIENNLNHFRKNTKADFYFKRSYSNQILEYAPENCKVFPLGLNIPFKPEGKYPTNLLETVKNRIKDNFIISKYYGKTSFSSIDFEHFPIVAKENKILFLTKLWNPEEVSLEHLKAERENINKNRMDCIKACRKEFGKNFVGGLQQDSFSILKAKDLILPNALTKRVSFLKTVKESNICIATSGLHNSIGWKFGEYVAASRAIISEPLEYELPGKFDLDKNYFAYNNEQELLTKTAELLKNRDTLFEMMNSNFQYYNNYMRPDILILNTLLTIYNK